MDHVFRIAKKLLIFTNFVWADNYGLIKVLAKTRKVTSKKFYRYLLYPHEERSGLALKELLRPLVSFLVSAHPTKKKILRENDGYLPGTNKLLTY